MKIIGFVYNGERLAESGEQAWEVVLKADSCLLNGRKPFFLPEWSKEIGYTPCLILRVSRLGKEIAPKFADRYYDAVAYGADFTAMDLLRSAKAAGHPWTQALAFDYSLAIGEWMESQQPITNGQWLISPEEAIARASALMTIRQGDLIYIQKRQSPIPVHKEEIIRFTEEEHERLYCKIK